MVKIIDSETPKELLPFVKENSSFVKTTRYIYIWNLDHSDKYITLDEFVSGNDTVIQGVHAMRGHGEPDKKR